MQWYNIYMLNYVSNSLKDTEELAIKISKKIKKGDILAFFGEVGSGKTTFIKNLIKNLGCKEEVTSPTFSIINEYHLNSMIIAHFDMYRIENYNDLYNIGFFEYLNNENYLLIVEWAENIINEIDNYIKIKIEKINENTRKFIIQGLD